jgi:hypothetical protein
LPWTNAPLLQLITIRSPWPNKQVKEKINKFRKRSIESVKRDLKEWDSPKELVMDRSAWRLAINVPET